MDEFDRHRSWLVGLAYRLLGEVHEAEDAVQDAYVRWSGADRGRIEVPRAWLAKVVTNLCLNRLTSARARRETYPGPWLPEPAPTGVLGPLETVQQRESVSLALLLLMERLTPAERAVFVLREAFSYPHREIAGILDVTEAGSRQLHRRARQRLGEPRPRFESSPGQWRRLVERFLAAAVDGDVAALEEVLAADVVCWADGGGKVSAARRPITGRDKVIRYVLGLTGHGVEAAEFTIEDINASPALVYRTGGALVIIAVPEFAGDRIVALYGVLNPEKLTHLVT